MLIEDSHGWIDDFRALPGEGGSELSRRIHLHSLMNQGTSLRQIKHMGFSKELVADMNKQLVREEYGPNVGDLVKYVHTGDQAKFHSEWNDWYGIVTRVETVKMPGLPGLHTMCDITWTNRLTGSISKDYISEKNLEVMSSCK